MNATPNHAICTPPGGLGRDRTRLEGEGPALRHDGAPANLQTQISDCCPGWRILATFEPSPSLVASLDWFVRPPPP
jgi:hypothetical protein